MTASAMWPLFESHDKKTSNSLDESSGMSDNFAASPAALAESLLDRKVVGGPSALGVISRRHSVSLPGTKLSQTLGQVPPKAESSLLLGSNKENRFRQRSCSEAGEVPRPSASPGAGGAAQVNSSRYKTELCRPYEENGTCKYGDKCQFAHGLQELRSLNRHPKYKTELCRTFHSVGFCPYGPRCHFIHNAEERCGPPPPLSAFNKPARPRLQHSLSFAGFPSSGSLLDSPTSLTPPAAFPGEDHPLARSGLLAPSPGPASHFDPSSPGFFRSAPESPASPPDSLSDQEGSHSSSESSLLEASRRLPIFSTLSISEP